MRSIFLAFVLALCAPHTNAQCTSFGAPCASSGMQAVCGAPRIGTNWMIGERSGTNCGGSPSNPIPMFTLFGSCLRGGLPIDPPLACAACTGCRLLVMPGMATLQWTWPPRTTTLPIPNDRNLVGAGFCIQNACVDVRAACVCLSSAMQVTIQP